jgi:hypothetical protein
VKRRGASIRLVVLSRQSSFRGIVRCYGNRGCIAYGSVRQLHLMSGLVLLAAQCESCEIDKKGACKFGVVLVAPPTQEPAKHLILLGGGVALVKVMLPPYLALACAPAFLPPPPRTCSGFSAPRKGGRCFLAMTNRFARGDQQTLRVARGNED